MEFITLEKNAAPYSRPGSVRESVSKNRGVPEVSGEVPLVPSYKVTWKCPKSVF